MDTVRTYMAYYQGRTIKIQATSSYHAQNLAALQFGARKAWKVAVVLADTPLDTASIG